MRWSRTLGVLVVGAGLLVAGTAASPAQDDPALERERQLGEVQQLIRNSDSYAAAEQIQSAGSVPNVVKHYVGVVDDLYWKAKDLPASIAVGRAAILYCLSQSQSTDDANARRTLRVSAQELSFNLASYAWPGWDEKGIAIGPAELAAGLDAARLDLRLVRELGYPPEKHANAHWIVGAQLLAASRPAEAGVEFAASRDQARLAKDATKEWMARGYEGVALALSAPEDDAGRQLVNKAKAALVEIGTDDSRYLATQLDDVLRVFSAE